MKCLTSKWPICVRLDVVCILLEEPLRLELLWLWKEVWVVMGCVDRHVHTHALLHHQAWCNL